MKKKPQGSTVGTVLGHRNVYRIGQGHSSNKHGKTCHTHSELKKPTEWFVFTHNIFCFADANSDHVIYKFWSCDTHILIMWYTWWIVYWNSFSLVNYLFFNKIFAMFILKFKNSTVLKWNGSNNLKTKHNRFYM